LADIFQEVEEDLRRENLAKLWRRYGPWIIGLAVAIVVATAAVVGWRKYDESQRAALAREYAQATDLLARADRDAALHAFAAIGAQGGGYGALARLQEAQLLARAGDDAGAAALYERVAADRSLDQPYRDLAVILLALHGLDSGDPAALTARLEPLTAADNPWRYSALELTGLLAKRAGQTARAREIFAGLADDLQAPLGVRERATQLLASLPG
jgi:hypothetical protein